MYFSGRIDASAHLAALALPAGPVILDTDGGTFINSIGMREWLRFVRSARAGGRQITLERVADVLMTQMNMLDELQVTSFHAQYACAGCGFEAQRLIDAVAKQGLQMLAPPRLPCPECGDAMELADFPERYLTIFRT